MITLLRFIGYVLILLMTFQFGSCSNLLGCSKCNDKVISLDLKHYFFNFKPGSYWIYQNTKNGDLDSVYFVKKDSVLSGGNCTDEYVNILMRVLGMSLR